MYVVIIGMTLVVVACIVQAYAAVNESRGMLTGMMALQDLSLKNAFVEYTMLMG